MNKLTLENGKKCYEIQIENNKYIYGNNYSAKFELMQICRQVFNKNIKSEFQEEYQFNYAVKLNENSISIKNWNYYELHPHYNLELDLKLNSNSLILKYLECYGTDSNYIDEITTINNLLSSFAENLLIENEHVLPLHFSFDDLEMKQIMKMMKINLWNYEFLTNQNDFSYEDFLMFQIKLIKTVAERKKDEYFLVIIDLPNLTPSLINELESNKNINLFILITTAQYHSPVDLYKYIICEKLFLDMNNEEQLYELFLNQYNGYIELDDFKTEIKSIISGKETNKSEKIYEYL